MQRVLALDTLGMSGNIAPPRKLCQPLPANGVCRLGESILERPFRFFDNREKYLLFITTCTEKWSIAERVAKEVSQVRPSPPALRLFDAGIGDGTVLTSVLRTVHETFPHRALCSSSERRSAWKTSA